jgi:L-fuculose-phosphate aldolase
MNTDRARTAAEIVRVCRRLYGRGLIAGAEGNVSARIGRDVILATPAGRCKGDLEPDEIVELSLGGIPRDPDRKPSTEIRMHLRIYEKRSDVLAVVHAHPPTATGFAVAGEGLMAPVLPELMLLTGPVPLVPYGQPGTEALADRLDPFLADHDAFLLANHGATTVGRSLEEALHRMETLEHGARILLTARQLGRVNELPPQSAAALRLLHATLRSST